MSRYCVQRKVKLFSLETNTDGALLSIPKDTLTLAPSINIQTKLKIRPVCTKKSEAVLGSSSAFSLTRRSKIEETKGLLNPA